MCHTVTTLPPKAGGRQANRLVVGGRSSPYHALGDCWFQRVHVWERVEDLPKPLYRHCATSVTDRKGNNGVLIYGGKSNNGTVNSDWLLWRDVGGWTKLKCMENRLTPRFGAAMSSDGLGCGLLFGGMAEDGTVLPEFWRWRIDFAAETPEVEITAHFHESPALQQAICRFGACLVPARSSLYLVGGISRSGILPDDYNVLEILSSNPFHIQPMRIQRDSGTSIPLLIGHSSIWDGDGLVVVGGGAVCFSFGNYSNPAVWKVLRGGHTLASPWTLFDRHDWPDTEEQPQKRVKVTTTHRHGQTRMPLNDPAPLPVRKERMHNMKTFERLVHKAQPVVVEGLGLGCCSTVWTTEYLKREIGGDREVRYRDATRSI